MTDALFITLVGMGLVFTAIILLWGLMALVVKLASERAEPEEKSEAIEVSIVDQAAAEMERKHRAAIAAVSIALAQQTDSTEPHEFPLPEISLVTAWQAVMRSKMLNKRGSVR